MGVSGVSSLAITTMDLAHAELIHPCPMAQSCHNQECKGIHSVDNQVVFLMW